MSDLISGTVTLKSFVGFAACGGFSYGDVLGAGSGWSKSIILHPRARDEFFNFLTTRTKTFALGVCSGCQFLSHLASLVPGAASWPTFACNQSEQFEARVSTLKIFDNRPQGSPPSVFLRGMEGSEIPIAVAHGEGRAEFRSQTDLDTVQGQGLIAARYIDNYGNPTQRYPYNPNGSPDVIAAVQSPNGRVLPHPERVVKIRGAKRVEEVGLAERAGIWRDWQEPDGGRESQIGLKKLKDMLVKVDELRKGLAIKKKMN
jgi:phosphoribosylformylglycinamidine synthase